MPNTLPSSSKQQKEQQRKVPEHVAIIMDGNRRYAKEKSISSKQGHTAGAETLVKITEVAEDIGIKYLTVYAFSSENWKREQEEVKDILNVLELYLIKMRPVLLKKGIKFSVIGDISVFPHGLRSLIKDLKEVTKNGDCLELIVALNYGARAELTRAMKNISTDLLDRKLMPEEITEELIGKYLYTANYPDPDLLIRTSGEQRLSNFLLWQISYSELYAVERFWPEFTEKDLHLAIETYMNRNKRLGA